MAALVSSIVTLTPTHCGTGQANAVVDLPIARDVATGHPVLPATSLKGVARAAEQVSPGARNDRYGHQEGAGSYVFYEGHLLAFPVRSLTEPLVHVTSPMAVRRWNRLVEATGAGAGLPLPKLTDAAPVRIRAAGVGPLVLEGLHFPKVSWADPELAPLEQALHKLATDPDYAAGSTLALVSDAAFAVLVRRGVPVQARIALDPETKTTTNGGNLWYEEVLPADCLFGALLDRRDTTLARSRTPDAPWNGTRVVQIGGNETVGMGLCRWTFFPPVAA